MVDFINEVEDALRKDQYNALLKRWGPWIAAVAVLVVLASGVFEYFQSADERIAKSTSLSYVEAQTLLDEGNAAGASGLFTAIAQKARPGYAGLSLMQASGIALDNGNRTEALRLLDQAANIFETQNHQDLAALKAAYLLMDNADFEAVKNRAAPLSQSGRPYEFLAREVLAFVALEQGDTQTASSQFSFLARSPDVPDNLKARAEQALALIPVTLASVPKPELETPELNITAPIDAGGTAPSDAGGSASENLDKDAP